MVGLLIDVLLEIFIQNKERKNVKMNEYTINEYLKLVVKERDKAIKDNNLYDLAMKAIKDTEKFCDMENELLFLDFATDTFQRLIKEEYDVKLEKNLKNLKICIEREEYKIELFDNAKNVWKEIEKAN